MKSIRNSLTRFKQLIYNNWNYYVDGVICTIRITIYTVFRYGVYLSLCEYAKRIFSTHSRIHTKTYYYDQQAKKIRHLHTTW